MNVDTIIAERQATHGDYADVSRVFQALCNEAGLHPDRFEPEAFAALSMILMKVARIVCGDPSFDDHWRDIEGYARLGSMKQQGG